MESLGAVLPLLLLAVLGYFLLIRPTRRRAQEVSSIQNALAVDAEVMLTSGIFGTVTAMEDEFVFVEVAPGVVLRVHRGAIGKVVTPVAHDDEYDAGAYDTDSADDTAEASTVDETDTDPDADHKSRGAN